MPGPLKYYASDPMKGSNRGSGWYYHRGNGYYSKYSGTLDALRRHGPFWNNSKKRSDPYRHTHDYPDFKLAPVYPTNYSAYKHKRREGTNKRFLKTKSLQYSWAKRKKKAIK